MSRHQVGALRPFLSVLIIISTLFFLVFLKMEVRRIGYSVLVETRQYKALRDEYRHQVMTYAQMTQPDRVRNFAVSQLTLSEARNGQIIQLSAPGLVFIQ